MNPWALVYDRFDRADEGLREALCTLGNGYFATRGAVPWAGAGGASYPGTYLAGGYDRQASEIGGKSVENEDLVNLPDWLPLNVRIGDGPWFDPEDAEILAWHQILDLKNGLLLRTVRFADASGRVTRLAERRLVHMGDRHLAAQELTITAENWSGPLTVRVALDGDVENAGVARYAALERRHLEPVGAGAAGDDRMSLQVRFRQARVEVAMAARVRVFEHDQVLDVDRTTRCPEPRTGGRVEQELRLRLDEGATVRVEKVVALYTSRDRAISEPGLAARDHAARAGDFGELAAAHLRAWHHLWGRFDVELETTGEGALDAERAVMILRLHVFHLLQTASPHIPELDVGVPARGLHGEAYRGHIFWDELFIFPLLNLQMPEITRALLMYRARRLDAARRNARAAGFEGAMYPWQSGSDGREETQVLHLNPRSGRWNPDRSHLQRHVNAAIAYNFWRYYQTTEDREFMVFHGTEVLVEIARFFASLARFDPEAVGPPGPDGRPAVGRWRIRGVMGLDEYHDAHPGEGPEGRGGLDDNAYTNLMAVWCIRRALDALALLPAERRAELSDALVLGEAELRRWDDVSRRMRVPFHRDPDAGPDAPPIISQFDGYEALDRFDWDRYRDAYGDIQRLDRILEAEGDTPNRYQVSKQADALMLFYLFSVEELAELFELTGHRLDPQMVPQAVMYYLQRTSHGSTLSRVVHAWVLGRSDRAHAWDLFVEALESDLSDVQGGTTPEGIHLGAMAGTVDLVQRGFTGIETSGDVLRFDPCLPDKLARLSMQIRYRGHSLAVEITRDRLTVTARHTGAPVIQVGVRDAVFALRASETRTFPL